jgi:putative FmdB family regulatory protein
VPTYSYACTECGNRFDAVQAFTDDALTTCDRCSGRLRKLFGSVGVVFKGSGFYRNDSREAHRASKNGSGHGPENASDKSSASSSSETNSGNGSGEKSGSTEKSDKSGKSESGTSSTTAAATSG